MSRRSGYRFSVKDMRHSRSPVASATRVARSVRSVGIAMLLLFVALAEADAADIDVKRLDGGSTVVVVEGKLDFSDIEAFRAKVAALPAAGTTVAFRSKGGRLFAGIRIGKLIRSKRFTTVVPDAAECASACALAWL